MNTRGVTWNRFRAALQDVKIGRSRISTIPKIWLRNKGDLSQFLHHETASQEVCHKHQNNRRETTCGCDANDELNFIQCVAAVFAFYGWSSRSFLQKMVKNMTSHEKAQSADHEVSGVEIIEGR